MAKKPSIDVTEQAALGAEVPPELDITREVFQRISEASTALFERGETRGALIVIGKFASIGEVRGANQRGTNPFEGMYLSAGDKAFQHKLLTDEALEDGAVIVDTSGQVLGGRIYLLVTNWDVDIPENCFSRHIAAASWSMRRDIESVITLSEQNRVVRIFRDGQIADEFDPELAAKNEKARKSQERANIKAQDVEKSTAPAKKSATAKVSSTKNTAAKSTATKTTEPKKKRKKSARGKKKSTTTTRSTRSKSTASDTSNIKADTGK